jgi:hypothetical protein
MKKNLKIKKFFFIFFLFLTFFSNNSFFDFEKGEVFGQGPGGQDSNVAGSCSSAEALSGKTACGSDVSGLYSKGIYVCEWVDRQIGDDGYFWVYSGDSCPSDENCVDGKCASAERNCSSVAVAGTPPGVTNVKFPSASHGQKVCSTGSNTLIYSAECEDGSFVNQERCDSSCAGGECDGDDNSGEDEKTSLSDEGDDVDYYRDDETGDNSSDAGGVVPSSNNNDSGSGGSWFGINTAAGVAIGGGFESDPVSYVQLVLESLIGLAGLVAAGFIVFGAYSLITSNGEPENIAKAQKMITNAIIGLVIAAIAFLIVNFVIVNLPAAE